MIFGLILGLIAQPWAGGFSRNAGETTYFNAAFDKNGADPTSNTIGGVTFTTTWWGDDPTGSLGYSTEEYTATGTPDTGWDTPFCYAGSGWADLSGCNQAAKFVEGEYYTAGDVADFGAAFSVCWVSHGLGWGVSSTAYAAGKYTTVGGADGWYIKNTGAAAATFHVIDKVAGSSTAADSYSGEYAVWAVYCGTWVSGGTAKIYRNGIYQAAGNVLTATNDNAENLMVGAGSATLGGSGFLAFLGTVNAELTSTQVASFSNAWMGLLDTKNAVVSFTTDSNAQKCCWIAGAIECFSRSFQLMGCEIAPNMTGAGAPAVGGLYAFKSITNLVSYSTRVDNGWTAVGSSVVSCAVAAEPFRDGRHVCRLTDNDAAALEYIKFDTTISSLATGDKVQIVVDSYDASGTVLDLQVVENTVCAGNTTEYAAKTIDATWKRYSWEHTVVDGTCTKANIRISPADFADVANTGTAKVIVQVFAQTWVPSMSLNELVGSSSATWYNSLRYAVSGVGFLDGAGNIKDNVKISMDFIPTIATQSVSGTLLSLDDNSASDIMTVGVDTSKQGTWTTTPGGTDMTTSAVTYTPGTSQNLLNTVNYTTDVYSLIFGAETDGSTTARASPTGILYLRVGHTNASGVDHPELIIKNLRIYK